MDEIINITLLSGITDANLKVVFSSIIILILIGVVASGVDFLLNGLLIPQINKRLSGSKYYLPRLIAKHGVLNSLSRISLGLVFVFGSFIIAKHPNPIAIDIATIVIKSANIFNICILNICLNKCIRIYHDYHEYKVHHNFKPIESYVKVVQFLSWIVTLILIVSYIFNRTPVTILTGIGAISAFILIIFKDTFLGIVASIQASATQLVKVGDWIVIDKYNINGEILDISINFVKIRNSDFTITTIPTHILTTDAVRNVQPNPIMNGRGFTEAIYLNPMKVGFLNIESTNRLKQNYPEFVNVDMSNVSNLTLFRLHLEYYLNNHDKLNHAFAKYIKTLTPAICGLSIEVCAFTTQLDAIEHNKIKSGITEYILATLNSFELAPAAINLATDK
jgi:miniconductance mechanosensitive channel